MRLCQFSLCDEAATVWFRGEAFCGAHALKRWGRRDIVLAARFSEIHRALQAAERDSLSSARSGGTPSEVPSTGRTAVMGTSVVASVTASEPPAGEPSAPLSEADLLDILERENWGEPWD